MKIAFLILTYDNPIFLDRIKNLTNDFDLYIHAKYPEKSSSKTVIREIFARPKAVLDLFIFRTKPKIMGAKENIIT